jgi:hypothetical protein
MGFIALLFVLHRRMSLKGIERLHGGRGWVRKDINETKLK